MYIYIYTRKLPRVIAIKIEESNEFNVETLSLHLTAKVEFHELFFGWVEAKTGHNHVMLVIIGLVIGGGVVVVTVVGVVVGGGGGGDVLLALALAETHGG